MQAMVITRSFDDSVIVTGKGATWLSKIEDVREKRSSSSEWGSQPGGEDRQTPNA